MSLGERNENNRACDEQSSRDNYNERILKFERRNTHDMLKMDYFMVLFVSIEVISGALAVLF